MLLQIEEYQRENPAGFYSWEIHERLLEDGVCDGYNVPTISAINKILHRLARTCASPASVSRLTNNSSGTSHGDGVDSADGQFSLTGC